MRLPSRRIALPLAGLVCGMIAIAALLLADQGPSRGAPAIGGPFALVDQNGRPVTDAAFRGKPLLMFFGYTHCPDVCPTTLSDLTAMLEDIGPGPAPGVAFVTVDPERDTPSVMKDYLSGFDPRIVGLTGTPAAVAQVLKDYRVYARKVPATGDDYSMDHTAIVYLMDARGNFVQSFNAELEKPAEAAAAVKKLL